MKSNVSTSGAQQHCHTYCKYRSEMLTRFIVHREGSPQLPNYTRTLGYIALSRKTNLHTKTMTMTMTMNAINVILATKPQ